MWTWASIPPGKTNNSETSSITFASALISPISQIFPLATAMSQSSRPFSVTVFPFLKIMSKFLMNYTPMTIYFSENEHSYKVD